jgi:glutamate/tyrosine decarboxylase-like PLP-dependent enzyme
VCWEKAARYLEVEERYWYCKPGQYVLDPQEAADLIDEVCDIMHGPDLISQKLL